MRMPTVAYQPGPDPSTDVRPAGEPTAADPPGPPEDLLPSGGSAVLAPALAPHRALALEARLLLRILRDRPRDAGPWGGPAFAREVDAVRVQLRPIRDRRGLAASYGREAFRMPEARRGDTALTLRPTGVAYALRWLELGDGQARPGWIDLVTVRD